ncbi:MFS transporter [Ancylobacter radicis]|uniref:MFS transporter n=1 Tax=Ancylobacter radicis TaxID=2836179 RepID=A0ABS5R529_9HYPH|nr:MFS transporter [Ancylobacter radicis]MBS9476754.1 MFS transporter [Ancylobacter radicis]
MSAGDLFGVETEGARAGRLGCACPEDSALGLRRGAGEARLAAGFALVVLAQALTLGVLPLAGDMLAPPGDRLGLLPVSGLPLAAFLGGAALASLPASLLLDAFGRRAGFALGASLGVAGGLVCAYALVTALFAPLVLGAFWLGAAQGFGMFYRHAAAFGAESAGRPGAVARLIGAGALAGLAGPLLAGQAEALAVPYTFAGTLVLAALAQLGALGFAVTLPEARFSHADFTVEAAQAARQTGAHPALAWRALALPTLIGALAWGAMTSAMAGAPLALIGCGVSVPLVSGIVAWHVVAMYGPALAGGVLARRIGAPALAVGAVMLCAVAAALVRLLPDALSIGTAFLAVGAGWSLAMCGATLMVHERGRPSRLQLAAHDGTLLAAALAGVFV